MSQSSKSGSVSIANIIAIIGLAALGVVSFFGAAVTSDDGSLGGAVMWALAIVLVLGFFLFMAIKAKGAESDVEKWRFVEYGALALYIVAAVLLSSPFHKFFKVSQEKESLQRVAYGEIESVESLYDSYNKMVKSETAKAVEQMTNYVQNGGVSSTMEAYISKMAIDKKDIATWAAKVKKTCKLPSDTELETLKSEVAAWDNMSIAQVAKTLAGKGEQAADVVSDKMKENIEKSHVIPIIRNEGGNYVHDGYVERSFDTPETGDFHRQLTSSKGGTALSWILFAVLNILVLLNYVVASRSSRVGPGRKRKDEAPSKGTAL